MAEPPGVDPHVKLQALTFASDLMATVGGVLPDYVDSNFVVRVKPRQGGKATIGITPKDELGIRLSVNGKETFRLVVTYECMASPVSDFLTVSTSTFKVNLRDSSMPLFTLDYVRDSGKTIPSAHYNIHAKRDDMVTALLRAGASGRGKIRRRDIRRGVVPRFGDVHFPLGGDRFRPCLEDILEFMIHEFGIDKRDGALEVLADGRQRWRKKQLAAAVSDDPRTAVEELRRLGLDVVGDLSQFTERVDRTGSL